MRRYVVKLTMDQAKQLGIVRCANCGYPPNNHFSETEKSTEWKSGGMGAMRSMCAHAFCKGYEPKFSLGMPIAKSKRVPKAPSPIHRKG